MMVPVDVGVRSRGSVVALVALVSTGVVLAALGVLSTRALDRVGFVVQNPYAWNQLATGASATFVGAFVARRRPDHPMGWLLVVAGVMFWCSFAAAPGIAWLMGYRPGWEPFTRLLLAVGVSTWLVGRGLFLTLVPLAFPDGFGRTPFRRVVRGASTTAIAVSAVTHSMVWTPEYFGGEPTSGIRRLAERVEPWGWRATSLLSLVAIGLMLSTSLRRETRAERRGDLLFSAAVAILLVPSVVDLFSTFVRDVPVDWSGYEGWTMFALPLVLAVAILRHGTLDIEVVIQKATLYTGVVLTSSAVYLVVVWAVATVRPDSALAPVLGAGAVALTLGVIRDRLQHLVARRLFGTRDDPYEVLAALGAQLEAAPASDHALQAVTDTVCDQLRLPYAAVDLELEEASARAAETGTRPEDPASVERFALTHRGVALGELAVARRTPAEPLTDGERRLLASLARQAGVLAHNVTLVEALRRSRVVLLNAREEERRRIRGDLHDGLGPTLATVAMGLEASSHRLQEEPELAALLADMERELQTAITDVRTLVYGLRPAALDDLGLVRAVQQHARNLAERSHGTAMPLVIRIDAPEGTMRLPAAVEVAAYRVALEALTNVARHACAAHCSVRLATGDGFDLSIEDDGVGLAQPDRDGETAHHGVGLQSMRERVTELGGRFAVRSSPGAGTQVSAWFPVFGLDPW